MVTLSPSPAAPERAAREHHLRTCALAATHMLVTSLAHMRYQR
jgi:hypothetical protein